MFFSLTEIELLDPDEELGFRIAVKLSPVWPLLARRYTGTEVVRLGDLNIGLEGVEEDFLPALKRDFELAYKLAAVDILADDESTSTLTKDSNPRK